MRITAVTDLNPLSILVVEDEALVAMQLQFLIEDTGHSVAGWATDIDEAHAILARCGADLALVDIHLADGPTGTQLAEHLLDLDIPVVFMTANAKRLPDDFVGAIGIIAKPYTANSITAVIAYLHHGVRNPPPSDDLPSGLKLSPAFTERWVA